MAEVLIAGDWHGNTRYATRIIEEAHRQGIQEIYHLGDFGIWPGEEGQEYLARLNQECDLYGIGISFVDGNHEDFVQLYAMPIDEEIGLRQVTDYIWHIPRGHRFEVDGKVWMGLGGAVSVDQHRRRQGIDWWPEEALTLSDALRASNGGPVDVMLTHDCPDRVEIPGLDSSAFPSEFITKAEQHREYLGEIVNAVTPKFLFHGHYHRRYDWHRIGPGFTTKIFGLDCDGMPINDNALVLNTETMETRKFVW
jgi:hypothetical protein